MNTPFTSSSSVRFSERRALDPEISTRNLRTSGLPELAKITNPSSPYPVSLVISQEMEITVLPAETVIPCDIESFSPEPYRLMIPPLRVVVVEKNIEGSVYYIASHHHSNIHASGDSQYEAIENLKSAMLDIFEILNAEPKERLGIKAKHQLALLQTIFERV
jgi:predicted RNase H-like HicB family nuclease